MVDARQYLSAGLPLPGHRGPAMPLGLRTGAAAGNKLGTERAPDGQAVVLLFFGAAVGFSMLGQGRGVLYAPMQVMAGVGGLAAATTSLFLIIGASLFATLVLRRARREDWPLANAFTPSRARLDLAIGRRR